MKSCPFKSNFLLLDCLVLFAAMVNGCVHLKTYFPASAAKVPDSQTGRVQLLPRTIGSVKAVTIGISAIDGVHDSYDSVVRVLPGHHVFLVWWHLERYDWPYIKDGESKIPVDVKAGGSYALKVEDGCSPSDNAAVCFEKVKVSLPDGFSPRDEVALCAEKWENGKWVKEQKKEREQSK